MMRVFVADDSARLREQIICMLSGLNGIEIVGQAPDAAEAFHAIRELKPDVVTLDINMIGGSGIDLLQKIKQEDKAPVVIMLTNLTSLPYRRICMKAGADFFLDKSKGFGKVEEIIQGLFERLNAS